MSARSPEVCHKCQEEIYSSGLKAMGLPFHGNCFTCVVCFQPLSGSEFYAINDEPHCEADYLETLDKCSVCKKPIVDRILRATNKPFHPECFRCSVCDKVLDDVPFTVAEQDGQIHCIEDYNDKYAPRCACCNQPIASKSSKEEVFRVVAMDKTFHVDCYKCEGCGMVFSTGENRDKSKGCYPVDGHLYCIECHDDEIKNSKQKVTLSGDH